MPDFQQLSAMSRVNLETTDKNLLADLQEAVIDPDLPPSDRLQHYLEQIKNPYCFKYKDAIVKISFSPEGCCLSDLLKNVFIQLKQESSQ